MPSNFTQILQSSRTAMTAFWLKLDTVGNNISNLTTPGYKASRANFQELYNDKIQAEPYLRDNGARVRATQTLTEQGRIRQTGNPLDLAINGEGYFAVKLPDGRTAYTRDGVFYLDKDRKIVNSAGCPLVWQGQIPQDATNVHVNPDGTVMTLVNGVWNQAGQIQINRFANVSGLTAYGNDLLLATDVSGAAQAGNPNAQGFGVIMGEALEDSNVNMAEEYTQMIVAQRAFQTSLRTFQQTDNMLSGAIHMRK
jgi:flagellar basal-body rod protein FlgG